MSGILREMGARGPVLTDGAWGTELQRRGLPLGACPDVWNLTNPERVAEVARAYVAAGSRVILTNTFGANRVALARHGCADSLRAINQAGARISREAAGGRVVVLGSIGPSGVRLAAVRAEADLLRAAFEEQAGALHAAGVDGFVVETMCDLEETRIAVEAARATGLPVAASMVFGAAGEERTPGGQTPEEVADALEAAGASAIGANCGWGPGPMLPVCRRLRARLGGRLPVWMKPNAGLPEIVGGRAAYRMTPEEFAALGAALVEAGTSFIGGCCGAGPEFVRVLGGRVDEWMSG